MRLRESARDWCGSAFVVFVHTDPNYCYCVKEDLKKNRGEAMRTRTKWRDEISNNVKEERKRLKSQRERERERASE